MIPAPRSCWTETGAAQHRHCLRGGKEGQGERLPQLSGHGCCRDRALAGNRPQRRVRCCAGTQGTCPRDGQRAGANNSLPGNVVFGRCFLCSKTAPCAPELFCFAFIRNFQRPQCSVTARWFLHQSQVAFYSLGHAAYWCSLQSLPENEHNFAFKFLVCCSKLRGQRGARRWALHFAARLLF